MLSAKTEVKPNTLREIQINAMAISKPITFTTPKPTNSFPRAAVRFAEKVQYLLPNQATTVATATEITFEVKGEMPNAARKRLNTPRSTKKANKPTEPNLASSANRDRSQRIGENASLAPPAAALPDGIAPVSARATPADLALGTSATPTGGAEAENLVEFKLVTETFGGGDVTWRLGIVT